MCKTLVQVCDGGIFVRSKMEYPLRKYVSVSELLRSPDGDSPGFSVIGQKSNAELLCALYRDRPQAGLRVYHPRLYPEECFGDPQQAFSCLILADFVCAWMPVSRSFDCWDFQHYQLLQTFEPIDEHPAAAAIRFPLTADIECGFRLVAEIIDPRWFCHEGRPGRLSRIQRWLGLAPDPSREAVNRYQLVLQAWAGKAYKQLRAPFLSEGLNESRNFLWRVHADAGGGTRGALMASRWFIRLLYQVWWGRMYPVEQFDPDRFFRADEIQAWKDYVKDL